MSETQVASVLESSEFQQFFERSSRIVERALYQAYDVAVDYTLSDVDPNA